MKFSNGVITLLLSSLVAVDGLSLGFGGGLSQKVLGDGDPVPGENPLKYCQKDHSDDLLTLEKVDLSPNPPVKYVLSVAYSAAHSDRNTEAALSR